MHTAVNRYSSLHRLHHFVVPTCRARLAQPKPPQPPGGAGLRSAPMHCGLPPPLPLYWPDQVI